MNGSTSAYERRFEPRSETWRSASMPGMVFDTGQRRGDPEVEGTIRTPDHLILVTLRGGARHLEVQTDCGHRSAGVDRAGSVSLIPADCERRLRMRGANLHWASLGLNPSHDGLAAVFCKSAIRPMTNLRDALVFGVVAEMERVFARDGRIAAAYGETMGHALATYLVERYGERGAWTAQPEQRLAPWRLRRMTDYVDANLARDIAIADLANLVGCSTGHLHRAFRITTGMTPLAWITTRRIERAMALLAEKPLPVSYLAAQVGFLSTSHFAKVFKRLTGITPSQFRAGR